MKVAIISGVTTFLGKSLCKYLLQQNYMVHGLTKCKVNLPDRHKNLKIYAIDMNDYMSIFEFLRKFKSLKLEFYHIDGFECNDSTPENEIPKNEIENLNKNILSTNYLLQSIYLLQMIKDIKFFHPCNTDIFGDVQEIPQREITDFHPNNIHGNYQRSAYWLVKYYRNKYNLFGCNCILFNVEGETKNGHCISKEITKNMNNKYVISVGNLDSSRDWTHISDILEGIQKIMSHQVPEDVILSSYESHSIREFLEIAFSCKNIEIEWKGKGYNEKGYNKKNKRLLIKVDEKLMFRSNTNFIGNNERAYRIYNWKPKVTFKQIIEKLIAHDCPSNNNFFSCC
jgi:GDPmannose 4,6-dehydratase